MILTLDLGKNSYDIVIEHGAIDRACELLNLNRKVLVVTDSGVPEIYAQKVASACKAPTVVTVEQGEASKAFTTLEYLCTVMLEGGFTRTDAVVAVGGGVVGDLAGFASACFMRGIDFYNIPTTLLSQVDSSIGGKTAINHAGVKNCIGAFHQPKKVLIDPDVLATLPARQIANGLSEAIKMAACFDDALFTRMENEDMSAILDDIIIGSLKIKKAVVEQDETEKGLRRVLNFGHTLGHGIEACAGLEDDPRRGEDGLYHGECVALGMLPMCSTAVRDRILSVLKKAGLPTTAKFNLDTALEALSHDKKLEGDTIHYIYVPEIGRFEMKFSSLAEFKSMAKEALAR